MSSTEMPFDKTCHIKVIKTIAEGLKIAGKLDTYLELGVRNGSCFNAIAPLAKGKAYAVDINPKYEKFCKWNKNTDKWNKNLVWNGCPTNEFFEKLDKAVKFDLVFIDACHTHEQSLVDFKNVWPKVNPNGIICMHDTYPPAETFLTDHYCSDSYKTADYIRKNYQEKCEIVTLPFFFGVTIIRKADKQLMWI